jgi:hypothetical protein
VVVAWLSPLGPLRPFGGAEPLDFLNSAFARCG